MGGSCSGNGRNGSYVGGEELLMGMTSTIAKNNISLAPYRYSVSSHE